MNKPPFNFDGTVPKLNNALEASKIGSTVLGIKCRDCAVIAAEKKAEGTLRINIGAKKIFRLSDEIGGGVSGLTADSRKLVENLREKAENHNFLHKNGMSVDILAQVSSNEIHNVAKEGNANPVIITTLGICILLIGISTNQPRLFSVNPTCCSNEKKISVIGNCGDEGFLIIKEGYRNKMSEEELKILALKSIRLIVEQKLVPDNLELGLISKSDKKFQEVGKAEIQKIIKKI